MKIHYNNKLKLLARQLRRQSTVSEILLWRHLKNKQMKGYDFHRQKPIDEYIVDFFCPKLNLIIEIDGETHSEKAEQDRLREQKLMSSGFYIVRFLDKDVKQNIEGVLHLIEEWIEDYKKGKEMPGVKRIWEDETHP
ncbi:MAG: endonuclease domain-containing protein [Planctomycetes bacterium]|nr:endonuclease domain-containing protein [Planctomycetota bacterium]